jgi:hypothetical protein
MKYTIYKTTNTINDKVYIGKHKTKNPNDAYLGSGVAIKNAIKMHGKHNFNKEVLFIFDSEKEMDDKERELVNEIFISTEKTYNMGVGGEGGAHFLGRKHSEETKQKIKEKRKLQIITEETRKKIGEANKKRIITQETKDKLSNSQKTRWENEENKINHSKIMKDFYKKN